MLHILLIDHSRPDISAEAARLSLQSSLIYLTNKGNAVFLKSRSDTETPVLWRFDCKFICPVPKLQLIMKLFIFHIHSDPPRYNHPERENPEHAA